MSRVQSGPGGANLADSYREVQVTAADPIGLEVALAEAWVAGAAGVEEAPDGRSARIFVPEAATGAVVAAVGAVDGVQVGAASRIEDVAWSEAWKEGLDAVVVSERLCVRPPFAAAPAGFAGAEIVIDPGQAFGTGHHASTLLALQGLDEVRSALGGARVLDVGCGSGVLALAALALGATHAVAFDMDPLAGAAAGVAARDHAFSDGLRVYTGTTDALADEAVGFDVVVANMIRTEQEPLLGTMAARLRTGGRFVAAGLLDVEQERFTVSCRAVGLEPQAWRHATQNGDAWLGVTAEKREA